MELEEEGEVPIGERSITTGGYSDASLEEELVLHQSSLIEQEGGDVPVASLSTRHGAQGLDADQ